MADLVVIVPSRGRPAAAHEMVTAFDETCRLDTQIVFAIDKRDVEGIYEYPHNHRAVTDWSDSSSMVEALNIKAIQLLNGEVTGIPAPFAVAFMGDDHRPRTPRWDERYLSALHELGTGIVYGNDLNQGEKLPTQCAMTTDIVRALGYMAPPTLRHMYVDNYWLDLGSQAGCLRYLPKVAIEHLHPTVGKAEWDEGYQRVNSPEMFAADQAAYTEFFEAGRLAEDIGKVMALRADR